MNENDRTTGFIATIEVTRDREVYPIRFQFAAMGPYTEPPIGWSVGVCLHPASKPLGDLFAELDSDAKNLIYVPGDEEAAREQATRWAGDIVTACFTVGVRKKAEQEQREAENRLRAWYSSWPASHVRGRPSEEDDEL